MSGPGWGTPLAAPLSFYFSSPLSPVPLTTVPDCPAPLKPLSWQVTTEEMESPSPDMSFISPRSVLTLLVTTRLSTSSPPPLSQSSPIRAAFLKLLLQRSPGISQCLLPRALLSAPLIGAPLLVTRVDHRRSPFKGWPPANTDHPWLLTLMLTSADRWDCLGCS